jgi:hypothetical protein
VLFNLYDDVGNASALVYVFSDLCIRISDDHCALHTLINNNNNNINNLTINMHIFSHSGSSRFRRTPRSRV